MRARRPTNPIWACARLRFHTSDFCGPAAVLRVQPAGYPAGFLFARHVLCLGDASSLRAVVNGTARLGQGVRREAESEGSRNRNSDSTNRNRIQGRPRRVTRQWTRRPDIHSEAWAVDPARPEGKTQQLNLGGLSLCEDTPTKATTLSAW